MSNNTILVINFPCQRVSKALFDKILEVVKDNIKHRVMIDESRYIVCIDNNEEYVKLLYKNLDIFTDCFDGSYTVREIDYYDFDGLSDSDSDSDDE